MKKKLFSFLFFLVVCWSCTRNDDVIKTTDSDDIWHITINAQKSDEETKSLYFSENGALKIKWVAGQYLDVISVNHYHKWQPDQSVMSNWLEWSGKPFIITEFYTMGLDSGLQNHTGAGYIVKTQFDRGVFYQNFVIELLKSKGCVGWHWFQYMDNDPTSTNSDASNQDSNKGIVMWNCNKYTDFAEMMKEINNSTYRLAKFFNP